jgi:uncharacterized protein YqiB (DUF1249 family)
MSTQREIFQETAPNLAVLARLMGLSIEMYNQEMRLMHDGMDARGARLCAAADALADNVGTIAESVGYTVEEVNAARTEG